MRAAFTVALIGPDGAGKTTVARQLEEVLPTRAKYVYMGINWESSNHLLPTTRVVDWSMRPFRSRPRGAVAAHRDDPAQHGVRAGGRFNRLYLAARARLSLANLIAEEWYRQIITWTYLWRGTIVIFDRHFFFDYYADHVAGGSARPFRRRVHGFLLSRVYPKPDLVVYLDAPPATLFARKAEGTLDWLERRRLEYLEHASETEHFVAVDAGRPLPEVTREVAEAIRSFSVSRSRAKQSPGALR